MTSFESAEALEAPSAHDNKKVFIAGGVAAALLLGFGGYHFLLSGSSSDEALGGAVPHSVVKKPAKVVKARPAAKPVVPAASTVRLGRDPFLALYTEPVAPAEGTTTDTSTSSGTTTDPGTTGGTATSEPYALSLKSLTASSFTFTYEGATKAVVQGQKFGKYGELVVLSTAKNAKGAVVGALIQVGDDDPVTIKLGEKLTVL